MISIHGKFLTSWHPLPVSLTDAVHALMAFATSVNTRRLGLWSTPWFVYKETRITLAGARWLAKNVGVLHRSPSLEPEQYCIRIQTVRS